LHRGEVINLLPQERETLIVAHGWDVVLKRLEMASTSQIVEGGNSQLVLAGWVKDDRFQLMLRQRRPNSFMPIVDGRIDPTSTGCLIFLDYKLMPVTRMYLILWSIIVFISGLFVSIYYYNFLLWLASAGIIGFINGIAWANFKLHRRPLHDVLFKLLE
jgi:hypothetical protein